MKIGMLLKLIVIFSLSVMILSCRANNPVESPGTVLSKVIIFDLNNRLIAEITKSEDLSVLYQDWQERTEVVFVRRPEFKFHLHLYLKTKQEIWLYDGYGTIAQADKNRSVYYKISASELLKKYINPQF